MATNNSINLNAAGITGYDGVGAFVGTPVTAHNILIGGATSDVLVNLAPSATAGVALVSAGSSSDPAYGTVVVAGGGTGLATLTAYELMAAGTTSTGNMQQIGIGTSGQVLTSNGAGSLPSFQTTSAGFTWVDVVAPTQTLAVGTGYVTDNALTVTYTLPATAALGDTIRVLGGVSGTTGWIIAQNASQQIHYGSSATTIGTGGTLSSSNQYDAVELVAIVAGASTVWEVVSSQGNLTVV